VRRGLAGPLVGDVLRESDFSAMRYPSLESRDYTVCAKSVQFSIRCCHTVQLG